jgi:putative transposase
MQKRFSEAQIIQILQEVKQSPDPIRDPCRRHDITEQTFFRWRNKHGAMDVSEARRLWALEAETTRLKKIVAEQALAIDGLKEVSRRKW